MKILILVTISAVLLQFVSSQDDPFAIFNSNSISNTNSDAATNSFGQQPAPTPFGQQNQPQNTFGQTQQQNTFGQPQQQNTIGQPQQQNAFGQPQQQNTFGQPQQQNAFGQPQQQNAFGQPQQQNSFGQPQQNSFGQQQFPAQGNNPSFPQLGNQQQPGNQQMSPDAAFLVGGQWNPQQNGGRTMFSSFDPNNPRPFQQQPNQQNTFATGQFGGQQFLNPQNQQQQVAGQSNFLTFGTPGNDMVTFQDNNLPVGEVDNIRFGIGPNQQPFRVEMGSINFDNPTNSFQQQQPIVSNFSPFTPFAPANGLPVVDEITGIPAPGFSPFGGFDNMVGGFGGPGPQGFGSFFPPPPLESQGLLVFGKKK